MAEALLQVLGSASASAALSRSTTSARGRRRRAPRADRAERLRQEHAGQLPLRHPAQRDRQRALSTAKPLDGLIAHERTRLGLARSFQLPRPFTQPDAGRQSARAAALHGQRPARRASRPARSTARCARTARQVGLADKAERLPRDLTQVEMRKLELARAVATEPRLLFADEAMAGLSHSEIDDILAVLFRLNEHGITIVLIEHIMRAVMSFSQRLVVLVSGRRSPTARRRRSSQPRGREGLSWPVASSFRASTPATARCACSRTSRSASTPARPWRCSAPTATARAR